MMALAPATAGVAMEVPPMKVTPSWLSQELPQSRLLSDLAEYATPVATISGLILRLMHAIQAYLGEFASPLEEK